MKRIALALVLVLAMAAAARAGTVFQFEGLASLELFEMELSGSGDYIYIDYALTNASQTGWLMYKLTIVWIGGGENLGICQNTGSAVPLGATDYSTFMCDFFPEGTETIDVHLNATPY